MFKNLCSLVRKSNSKHTLFELNYLYPAQRYSFIRSLKKNRSSIKNDISGLEEEDYIDEKGNKIPFVKKSSGKFPYLPIGDHPLIPLYNRMVPITKELSDALINEKLEEKRFCVSVIKNPEKIAGLSLFAQMNPIHAFIPEIKNSNEVFHVGCICECKIRDTKDWGSNILLMPIGICKIHEFVKLPQPIGEVQADIFLEEDIMEKDVDMETLVKFQFLKSMVEKLTILSRDDNFKSIIISLYQIYNNNMINHLTYLVISLLTITPKFVLKFGFLSQQFKAEQIQQLIEKIEIKDRLEGTTRFLSEYLNKMEVWEKLEEQYDLNKEKNKATEKLYSIYENLKNFFDKEKDEKKIQIERFHKNLEGKNIPEHIMKIINEEIERFNSTDKHSMESNVIRNYLDILTSLPYGITTEENMDIEKARNILDESHYGMEDIKERILECIAVGNLKGKIQGKILCFVGPPGVGKTSIGESIANSLNRKFMRISVGGDRDTSTLKGFRRTYIGAIPGKIVKALKVTQTENPVILIDEIDKLGERNVAGDPSSVLLEILDPEQNKNFTDDYLDTPIDLSKVFFLCTANNANLIPKPLLDRMEMIEVSGYTFNEKKFIYEKYLKPRAINNAGLNNAHNFSVDEKSVEKLIHDYCRESGVRSLQRYTNRIFEKIALKIVQNNPETHLNLSNLKKFIGPAVFSSKKFYEKLPRGVSIGLGFNQYGGSILYIESSKAKFEDKQSGSFKITGSIGTVMQESCNIAHTYVKIFLNNYYSNNEKLSKFFDQNDIHIHFAEGAIPKDGPSAGVTIVTALISLALNKPIVPELAMTGEISLNGKVLPIGGIKEKIMAASREGMKSLIFPKKNKDDIDDLPSFIKSDLTFYYVENYEQIFKICFPSENSINIDENLLF